MVNINYVKPRLSDCIINVLKFSSNIKYEC